MKTFSIGFEEAEFDELRYARLVADRYATEHHEVVVRSGGVDVLPMLVRHYGEPFADSSAIPTYHVARLTGQHVRVALTGDGSDECLSGYERYLGIQATRHYQRIPGVVRSLALEPLGRLVSRGATRRSRLGQAGRFLEGAVEPLPQRYLRWMSYLEPEQKTALYTQELQTQLGSHRAEAWLLELWNRHENDGTHSLDIPSAVDMESYLPNDLLVKMDIATMAASLEARSPFLDHEVMEFCARLPAGLKIRGATLKYLLKQAAAPLLPPEIPARRKMGFGVPVGQWMRGELRPWVEDLLLSAEALKRGYFRPEAVRQLVSAHVDHGQDHSYELWALLWLELWHREFLN